MKLASFLHFAAIVKATTVFQLNLTSYYSPDLVAATFAFGNESWPNLQAVPITYLSFAEPTITAELLESTITSFLSRDDVYSEFFLSTLVLGGSSTLSYDAHAAVTRIYRLYWDHNFAFVESVTEGPNGTYVLVTGLALTDAYGALSIAVPSRLYYPVPTEDKPLSGKRLGVKDIYDLKGVRTSGGNRAYRDLVHPAPESAAALQKLIEMGAVVIGKTKTTQFALGERPTADYVDQLAPFNPRGDGYQHPQESSAGSGAGLESYDWMDIATASDTGGSVRLPATANGLFGMRITNASLPLNGILPILAIFDTPGVLARSAQLLQAVHRRWYPAKAYASCPKRIVLPDLFWPTVNGTSMHIFDSFISQLATFLDANLTTFNANASFNAYASTSEGLASYLGSTYSNITIVDQYRDLGLPFKKQYIARFGKAPYWNPQTRARWNRAATLPTSSYSTAIERIKMF